MEHSHCHVVVQRFYLCCVLPAAGDEIRRQIDEDFGSGEDAPECSLVSILGRHLVRVSPRRLVLAQSCNRYQNVEIHCSVLVVDIKKINC